MSDPPPPGGVLARVVGRVTEPPLLTLLAGLQAVALAVAVLAYLLSRADPAATDEPGTGDFLAFFTGASLIAEGRGAELYDFAVQEARQAALRGGRHDYFQGYLNPPALALALAPTVGLGYVPSFWLFGASMAAAFTGAARLARRELADLLPTPVAAATAALVVLGFEPVWRTMFGGQNTVLSLACVTVAWVGLRSGRLGLAGAAVGVLSFKPQLALVLGVALLGWRAWRAAAVAVGVGVLHYAAGGWVLGWGWPLAMLDAMGEYGPREMQSMAPLHFLLRGVVEASLPGSLGWVAPIASLAVLGHVAWALRGVRPGSERFDLGFAVLTTGLLLASPHLVFYDAGVLVLPVLLGLQHLVRTRGEVPVGARVAVAVGYFGYQSYPLGPAIGIQPLFVGLVLLHAALAVALARGAPGGSGPPVPDRGV